MARILCGDVLSFCRHYRGPLFHGVLCDPPYGLKFMGKDWDHGVPGERYWVAIREQCRPGAMLLAFGGTRTFHRLTCAIEDAGWEIRDCVMWVYGCLSEDTEILVDGRWEPYHKAIAGRRAMCYNPDDDSFSWQPIQDLLVYEYDDTAFRIESDSTDQLVSRNHRCLVERGGNYVFQFAEEAAREREACVPILEGVRELLRDLPLHDQGSGDSQQDVRPRVRCESGRKPSTEEEATLSAQGTLHQVRGMREACVEAECVASSHRGSNVLVPLQRDTSRPRVEETRAQGTGGVVGGCTAICVGEDARGEQPGMEGRGDVLQEARKLQAHQVRSMPRRVCSDGAQGRIRDGASASSCEGVGATVAAAGGCPSHRPRSNEQRAGESTALCDEPRSQAVRASRYTRSDLARVTPIHYHGRVWCVRVPTGAFVARRNGKVFVTGNSGFPKSHDISKAIDKAAGAERETWEVPRNGGPGGKSEHIQQISAERKSGVGLTSAPATDAARQWQGYGTALKPSYEPVIVAMNPLDGTFAQNALKHGVAGINVDGCRVGTDTGRGERYGGNPPGGGPRCWNGEEYKQESAWEVPQGRWPANLIHDGSEEVVALFPANAGAQGGKDNRGRAHWNRTSTRRDKWGEPRDSLGSAARFFYCAKASRKERDAGLEGEKASPFERGCISRHFERMGSKSQPRRNHHPTVKPLALTEYLARLILPPEQDEPRRLFVPFAGSGSEMIGAHKAGWDEVIGVELEREYVEIARARLAHWVGKARQLELSEVSA